MFTQDHVQYRLVYEHSHPPRMKSTHQGRLLNMLYAAKVDMFSKLGNITHGRAYFFSPLTINHLY